MWQQWKLDTPELASFPGPAYIFVATQLTHGESLGSSLIPRLSCRRNEATWDLLSHMAVQPPISVIVNVTCTVTPVFVDYLS